ncbi:hypothetical protein CSOJ01_02183 [Colletotrichum sojae]|uniref:Uncharacterized protein n=1 Tax=Colletotrichum sojae TaxID=2175907 RepID=A0A8H6JRW0_9PEZI|nr:hypothetical protein CSOJ01_02183 [Colletotrichum sojae]
MYPTQAAGRKTPRPRCESLVGQVADAARRIRQSAKSPTATRNTAATASHPGASPHQRGVNQLEGDRGPRRRIADGGGEELTPRGTKGK